MNITLLVSGVTIPITAKTIIKKKKNSIVNFRQKF